MLRGRVNFELFLSLSLKSGCRKRSAAKGVRSFFSFSGTRSVPFAVTFSDVSVTFFGTFFAKFLFAELFLREGDKGHV